MGCNVVRNMRGKIASQIPCKKPRHLKGDLLSGLIMHRLI
jgi:hypothetical protein